MRPHRWSQTSGGRREAGPYLESGPTWYAWDCAGCGARWGLSTTLLLSPTPEALAESGVPADCDESVCREVLES